MGVFNALFGAASLPASLREGMADYNLVKCYVLLHDLTTGPANSQAAADGLQAAPCSALRCGERPAVCMPCTPHAGQGGGGALAAPMLPYAAARRPPRDHCTLSCPSPCPLQEISRAYGPDACKLLPINSRVAGAPPLPDLWTGARPPEFNPTADAPPPPNEQLGALLSDADMEQARTPTPTPTRPRPRPRPWP